MKLTPAKATIIAALITGIISILVTLIATGQFTKEESKLDVNNMPFAGVWEYDVRFSKFHRLDEEFDADGYIIVVWDEQLKQYFVYHTYTISRSWNTTEKVVTAFATGVLSEVNSDGWPDNPFDLTLDYVGRTGIKKFESTGSTSYTLENLTYRISDDNKRIESINGKFEFINNDAVTTAGTIEISRKK